MTTMTPESSLQTTGRRTVRRRLREAVLVVVAGLGLAAAGTAVAEMVAWLMR
jgi:hypothetical protein